MKEGNPKNSFSFKGFIGFFPLALYLFIAPLVSGPLRSGKYGFWEQH